MHPNPRAGLHSFFVCALKHSGIARSSSRPYPGNPGVPAVQQVGDHRAGGSLYVTFEEGTWAAWLYDLLKPHVTKVVACNPRRNALLKDGNKSDRIDARKLADLLRGNHLKPVYHGETSVRTLKELSRSYLTISKDLTRVMSRLKALYRSWGIPCSGTGVYALRYRGEWLSKIAETGVRRRAELFYQQLDALQGLRREARRELLAENRKHR